VTEDRTPEVEDEQGLVCFLGRTAEMCMFHFQWPTNEACSQPIKKTDENPSFPVRFSFRRSREQRSRTRLERLDEWATGRAAAAPARVGSKASNPTADGATETEAPGSRRAEAAGSSGRARAAAHRRLTGHSSQQERTVPWGRSLVLVCFWVKSR